MSSRRKMEEARRTGGKTIQEKLAVDFRGTLKSIDEALGMGRGVVREISQPVQHTTHEEAKINRIRAERLEQIRERSFAHLAYKARQQLDEARHSESEPISNNLKQKLTADLGGTLRNIDRAYGNPLIQSEYQIFASPRRVRNRSRPQPKSPIKHLDTLVERIKRIRVR